MNKFATFTSLAAILVGCGTELPENITAPLASVTPAPEIEPKPELEVKLEMQPAAEVKVIPQDKLAAEVQSSIEVPITEEPKQTVIIQTIIQQVPAPEPVPPPQPKYAPWPLKSEFIFGPLTGNTGLRYQVIYAPGGKATCGIAEYATGRTAFTPTTNFDNECVVSLELSLAHEFTYLNTWQDAYTINPVRHTFTSNPGDVLTLRFRFVGAQGLVAEMVVGDRRCVRYERGIVCEPETIN